MAFESDGGAKFEIKPNSGRAFKNNRAREGGKDANFTGTLVTDDAEYFLDIWVNAKDPEVQERLVEAIKYLNLRIKKKDKSRVAPGANEVAPRPLAPTQQSFADTGRYDPAPTKPKAPAWPESDTVPNRPRTTRDALDDDIPF